MKKFRSLWLVLVFQPTVGLFFWPLVAQAEVWSIYHRENNIHIEYNAKQEFSANHLLSALEEEEKKVSKLRPDLTSFVKRRCVILPVCSKEDQACLSYVQEVNQIRREIKAGFQKERILHEQKQASRQESRMLENTSNHIKANMEMSILELQNIDKIKDFLQALMDNQDNVLNILERFQEFHPDLENENKSNEQKIAEIREWVEEYYLDNTAFLGMLNTIEKILESRILPITQIVSDLYTVLLDGNHEVLNIFWQLMDELELSVTERIDLLHERYRQVTQRMSDNRIQRQDIEREREELWGRLKAKSARRGSMESQGYYQALPSCHNCLIP